MAQLCSRDNARIQLSATTTFASEEGDNMNRNIIKDPLEIGRPNNITPHTVMELFAGCKGDVLKQIGNAVPPLLAKAVGVCVRNTLESMCESATTDSMTGNLRDFQVTASRGETTWN